MMDPFFFGVTVMPEYIQSEGGEAVLDRLVKAGVNAVATSPYVMEPTDQQNGQREPPDDAGAGEVRLLDRPLWEKRELFVRTSPSFAPEEKLYQGLLYAPTKPDDLTRRQGPVIRDFLRAAQARHLKVYLQVQAAIPPGYRVQFGGPIENDRPRLPDGSMPERRLARNGSLASEHVLRYQHALIHDLCKQYPDINGLRFDWPEYPPYFLDDIFFDFSEHAAKAAARLKFDFELMKRDVGALYRKVLGGLTDADLAVWTAPDGGRGELARVLRDRPGITQWLRFKAILVEELLAGFRKAMNDAGGTRMEMMPNAFPPPWNLVSGMDYARAGKHSTAISVKHYTMHWPMMLRFYGDRLLSANAGLSPKLVAETLSQLLGFADGPGLPELAEYKYPEPNEPHPVASEALARKIAQAQREAGAVPIYTLAHGYGPVSDFERRLETAISASRHGVWVNRYGYLSDEKFAVIGRLLEKRRAGDA